VFAAVGIGVDAPEARAADVGQAGAETVARQLEQSENDIAAGAGVGHDLRGLQLGLLLKHDGHQHEAVTPGAGHRDGVEARARIGQR
jgi:hypothetical protein